jgi:uncharacterized protein YndB with AHSA1/START domain
MATQSSIQSSPARDAGLAAKPSLTIKRRINAAPSKIYAAWTDPEKLAAWFGPSKVKEGSLQAETDLRVGGRYRISFDATDGEHFQVGGVYREIVPNELLVMSWAWHSTPERESQLTISLKPDGAGTLLTLHHEQFFNEAARDGHEKGWNELLGKLEQFLT